MTSSSRLLVPLLLSSVALGFLIYLVSRPDAGAPGGERASSGESALELAESLDPAPPTAVDGEPGARPANEAGEALGDGRVSGLVIDASSELPLAELRLRLRSPAGFEGEQPSDSRGAFAFTDLPDGDYSLDLVDATRVLLGPPPRLRIERGSGIYDLVIRVGIGASVTGRVYEASGRQGVSGVAIVAHHQAAPPSPPCRAVADADGHYRLEGLAPGVWELRRRPIGGYIDASDRERVRVQATLGAVLSDVDFALVAASRFVGRVRDEAGAPIAEARVLGQVWFSGRRSEATTDIEGRFELGGFAAGEQVGLSASAPGYAFVVREERVPALPAVGPPEVLEIVLGPEAIISGWVRDPAGEPVEGIRVQPVYLEAWGAPTSAVPTDEGGGFRVGGLAGGRYRFELNRPGSRGQRVGAEGGYLIAAGQHLPELELIWESAPGPEICGRVLDSEGRPISGATIVARSAESGRRQTPSNAEGTYCLRDLDEVDYSLRVQHSDFAFEEEEGVRPPAMDFDFVLEKRATIEGVVLDPEGRPVERFEIAYDVGDQSQGEPRGGTGFLRVSDAEGRFRVDRVERGSATVWARAKGHARGVQVVHEIEPGEEVHDLRVVLGKGFRIEGVVVDANGAPLAGASVSVSEVPDRQDQTVSTDELGAFEITEVAGSIEWVTAEYRNHAKEVFAFEPGVTATPLRLELSRGATVEGRIRSGGAPVEGARVEVRRPSIGYRSTERSDASGHYRVAGLPRGLNLVEVTLGAAIDRPQRSLRKEITVEGSTSEVLDFNFAVSSATLTGALEGVEKLSQTTLSLHFEAGPERGFESFSASLDEAGAFRFDAVPAGPAKLLVQRSLEGRTRRNRFPVTLVAGEVTHRVLRIAKGATVRGRIVGLGASPFAMAVALRGEYRQKTLSLDLLSTLDSRLASTFELEGDGSFVLEELDPGDYTLIALALEEKPRSLTDLEKARFATEAFRVEANEEKEISLEIRGR